MASPKTRGGVYFLFCPSTRVAFGIFVTGCPTMECTQWIHRCYIDSRFSRDFRRALRVKLREHFREIFRHRTRLTNSPRVTSSAVTRGTWNAVGRQILASRRSKDETERDLGSRKLKVYRWLGDPLGDSVAITSSRSCIPVKKKKMRFWSSEILGLSRWSRKKQTGCSVNVLGNFVAATRSCSCSIFKKSARFEPRDFWSNEGN